MNEVLKKAGPQEVTISGWDGDEITVKLRRLSLVEMIVGEHIPNPLIQTVEKLFAHNAKEIGRINAAEQAKVMHLLASRALVEPTLEEIEAAGGCLTDDQYMEIYAFVIGGAASLGRFRAVVRSGALRDIIEQQREAQRDSAD